MDNNTQQESQRTSTQQVQNYDYIQYRLNNQPVVTKFEDTLSGVKREFKFDKEIQDYKEILTEIGKPLISEEGKQAVIGYFNIIANNSTVQGNLSKQELNTQLLYISNHLTKVLAKNGKKWLCVDNRSLILYQFIDHINIFLTRPVNNEERNSYLGVKQTESTTIKDNSKRFGFI